MVKSTADRSSDKPSHQEHHAQSVPVRRSVRERFAAIPLTAHNGISPHGTPHNDNPQDRVPTNGTPGDSAPHNGAPQDNASRDPAVMSSTPAQANDEVLKESQHVTSPLARQSLSALTDTTHALTDTSFALTGTAIHHDLAFRIEADGTVAEATVTSVAHHIRRDGDADLLSAHDAQRHHMLLIADDVDDDEVEALAVSLWEEAGWMGPGQIRLTPQARLEGPLALTDELRAELGVDQTLAYAWLLLCPPSRGPAPKDTDDRLDLWAKAFPQGAPRGSEADALAGLRRMARRLVGALRIAGSGEIIRPEADTAVSLALYAPRWLEPQQALAVLAPHFPEIIDSRELAPPVGQDSGGYVDNTLTAQAQHLSAAIRTAIEEDLRRAVNEPQVLDGYALIFPVGNRSEAMLEVCTGEAVPLALRWEPWARGAVVTYRLRWLPHDEAVAFDNARASRMERQRSARDIEQAASLLVTAVGGAAVDEDGFLIAFDQA
ncbi:hypothetical protein [Schaalia suimastitidis]|uniref:hypothetical protein n=1 Tax=Schaalia suimastitidis TaxID=121163 RepID=UPI0004234AE3|nr:hypothetical protein [Schaalia suimastitidis]